MGIAIGVAAPAVGKIADIHIAGPADRATDDACAAQDSATETLSQGIQRHRSDLDRLLSEPGPLARFGK